MADEIFEQEKKRLAETIEFLTTEIDITLDIIDKNKEELVVIRKEMWADGMSYGNNDEDMADNVALSQALNLEAIATSQYKTRLENLEKYQKMKDNPYFGRVDFLEDGEDDIEQVYIGYHNLMDDSTYDVLVYDWRAPICSVFYNVDIGKVSYDAPCGTIDGEVSLKRQYQID